MWPRSRREALVSTLEAESALAALSTETLSRWLPSATMAALPSLTAAGELPPDPAAIANTSVLWTALLDDLMLYGMGLVLALEVANAITGLGEFDLPEDSEADRSPVDDEREKHHRIAARVVAKSFAGSEDEIRSLARRLAKVPSIRQLQSAYLADVRNRLDGVPDRVYRDVAKDIDRGLAKGDSPEVMRSAVAQRLDPKAAGWKQIAYNVARTESAAAMSAATISAAQLRNEVLGENLEQTWICTLDGRTRKSHWAADGQRVPLGGKFSIGRAELRYPGDPAGSPAETNNCRCRVAILAVDESLPDEKDRHTERGQGDSTVQNRQGSQADEIERRADDGNIRARDDPSGLGRVASAAPQTHSIQEDSMTRARYAKGGVITRFAVGDEKDKDPDKVVEDDTAPEDDETEDDAEEKDDKPEGSFRKFTSVIAVLGEKTDDGRMLAEDIDLRFREFPLPVMWQKQSDMGHFASFTVGVMESASIVGTELVAEGYLLNTPEADEAADQISHKITGPSVDLGDVDWEITKDDGTEITEEDWWSDDLKILETVLGGVLMGFTLVAIPAFGQTSITLTGEMTGADDALVASVIAAGHKRFEETTYPAAFFTDPKFSQPTPPHITKDGRIMGHLAGWSVCHVGIQDRCQLAPRSQTEYAWFHTAPPVLTDQGKRVKVGRLTVGGGHASGDLGVGATVAHYDDAGTCFALVHCGEDEHGIWFSGVPAPGVTNEQLARGLAAPLSGDWRVVGGNLELVAALSVNTPGFPLVASGATDSHDRPLSLVAALGPCKDKSEEKVFTASQVKALGSSILDEFLARQKRSSQASELVARTTRNLRRREAAKLIEKVNHVRVQP